MKHQIIEKEIYSEADCLHFGEKYEMGVLINKQFPDYSGIELGNALFESEDVEEVMLKKEQLEIKRLRTLSGMVMAFFDDDEWADRFYSSENFIKLQELYEKEFDLELTRRNYNQMELDNDEFLFPPEASDEQILSMQKLLGIYFFKVKKEEV